MRTYAIEIDVLYCVSTGKRQSFFMKRMMNMDPMSFILFGATGDLAKRKIYPALFNLYMDNKLPEAFSVIGVGRETLNKKEFQSTVIDSLYEFSRHSTDDKAKKLAFVQKLSYVSVDVTQEESFNELKAFVEGQEEGAGLGNNRIFYLSVTPVLFDVITTNINKSGLGDTSGWKRVIIEKPFGHDLKSARALNSTVLRAFSEDEIYRIDHYLGKPMVQNLETLISANPVLQSVWSNQLIANVQITANETVGIGTRASYYEHSGAIRDMVQNHMLQLVMMTAVRMSERQSVSELRDEKIKLMSAIEPTSTEDVIRAQYTRLAIQDETIISGYTDEPGVRSDSTTDTFVAARLQINTPTWQGVPFFIRTGKRLRRKETKIVVEFKDSLNLRQNASDAAPNLLVIHINPNDGVTLQLNSKHPLTGELEPIKVEFSATHRETPEAYEFLLADAIKGDPTFFTHWDEVELAWQWIQPILERFDSNTIPLHYYQAGTNGPEEADKLLHTHGYKWW